MQYTLKSRLCTELKHEVPALHTETESDTLSYQGIESDINIEGLNEEDDDIKIVKWLCDC